MSKTIIKKLTMEAANSLNDEGINNIILLENKEHAVEYANEMANHTKLVAQAAKIIAEQTKDMDAEKAYIYGILHDYGKYLGDIFGKKSFHGLVGYEKLIEMGYPDIAKINLTHTFIEKDFILEEFLCYHKPDLDKTKQLLNKLEYDDYDKLIQLCDLLPKKFDGYCRFEDRFIHIRTFYGLSDEVYHRRLQAATALKLYFEEKCGCNIYKLLNIEEA